MIKQNVFINLIQNIYYIKNDNTMCAVHLIGNIVNTIHSAIAEVVTSTYHQ